MSSRLIFISDYFCRLEQRISDEILHEKEETILFTDIEELVDYYCLSKCLTPLELNPNEQPFGKHVKKIKVLSARDREALYRSQGDLSVECEHIHVTVPILNNPQIKTISTLTTSIVPLHGNPDISWSSDVLSFDIPMKGYGLNLDDDSIAAQVDKRLEHLKGWIASTNSAIVRENSRLRDATRKLVESRRAKLLEDRQRISGLAKKISIPLRQRENSAANRIKLDPKPIVKRVKPNPALPEEYVLDHSKVLDLASVIENIGRQFEKTPKTFANQHEEVLRDFILAGLNSLFEGKATSETFSNKGKTDIYLCIDKGNILVCECKFWNGQKLYSDTIDQLRSYLTWRQNFGILITFVRQKSFSRVLGSISSIVQNHKSSLSGFQEHSENHFVSHHTHYSDDHKEVEVHHLFYNLFFEH